MLCGGARAQPQDRSDLWHLIGLVETAGLPFPLDVPQVVIMEFYNPARLSTRGFQGQAWRAPNSKIGVARVADPSVLDRSPGQIL